MKRDIEIVFWPGIPFKKHVIWDDAEMELFLPHRFPCLRIVVDITHNRRLAAYDCACGANTGYCLKCSRIFDFSRMADMGHDGKVFACMDDLFKEPKNVIGIRVGCKAVRPPAQ